MLKQNKQRLTDFFNWLADHPQHQYTLGEAMPGTEFSIQMSRGARIVERAATLTGIFIAVAAIASAGPAAIPLAVNTALNAKILGLSGAALLTLINKRWQPPRGSAGYCSTNHSKDNTVQP